MMQSLAALFMEILPDTHQTIKHMKPYLLLLAFLLFLISCMGQAQNNLSEQTSDAEPLEDTGGEFKKSASGLIYSDTTMKQLRFIVDSLNLKFRTCELQKTYCSKQQAQAHYVHLEKGKITAARWDIENNISFEDFIKKYPQARIEKDLLVVKFNYINYEDKNTVLFSSIPLNQEYEHKISMDEKADEYSKKRQGTWVFSLQDKTSWTEESISCFYFITEFASLPLAENYARMVQYSNCMVDTNAQIFKENADRGQLFSRNNESQKVVAFLDYVNKETKKAGYERKEQWPYATLHQAKDSLWLLYIDNHLSKEKKFNTMLKDATEEALINGGSDDVFEEYVGRYYSLKKELELKRSRKVMGFCSMDNSPRIHAMNIAILSAKTINWETFLRAHLDIMNDRFERMSDGSYAWDRRQTYIKELEELEINVSDLLLGITLRIENPSQNHYYGNISRLGRALAETKHATEIESKMLGMVKDEKLDDYNRILAYYLFLNYNHWLEKEGDKKENLDKLKTACRKLPEYIASKIEFKED